jgi:hypothetical protein
VASLAQSLFWEGKENDLGNHGVQFFSNFIFNIQICTKKIRKIFPTKDEYYALTAF